MLVMSFTLYNLYLQFCCVIFTVVVERVAAFDSNTYIHCPEATSLDWKISVFGKYQCSATACLWEIEDILRLKRWENSVDHI
jgi:hypothetical protein